MIMNLTGIKNSVSNIITSYSVSNECQNKNDSFKFPLFKVNVFERFYPLQPVAVHTRCSAELWTLWEKKIKMKERELLSACCLGNKGLDHLSQSKVANTSSQWSSHHTAELMIKQTNYRTHQCTSPPQTLDFVVEKYCLCCACAAAERMFWDLSQISESYILELTKK